MANAKFPALYLCLFLSAPAWGVAIPIDNAGFEAPYLAGNLPLSYAGVVPPGGFPVGGPPTGWAVYPSTGIPNPAINYVGVLNPGTLAVHGATYFPAGAPEGNNVALMFRSGQAASQEYGIEQALDAVVTENTRYQLSVQVGNIASGTAPARSSPFDSFGCFEIGGFPGYRVELWGGNTLLVADDNLLTPSLGEGQFAPTTIEVSIEPGHVAVGMPLLIRLVNENGPSTPGNGCNGGGSVGNEVDFDAVALTAEPLALPEPQNVPLPGYAAYCLAGALLTSALRKRLHS